MKLGCRHPCPLIYLKVVSELLALIFFAAASGVCFTLYLTAKKLQNEFEGVFDRQRDVLMSASIINAILFILSFLATSYTVHLLSDYFEKDDHYFKQLWKLLGQDKIKTPLPSPHDEEPKEDDENTYLEPIVHFEGPAMSGKSQPTEPQKPAAAAMFSFVYNQGQNLPEEMNYSETIIEKIPKHMDFESFILEKFGPCRPIFDISIKPKEPNQSNMTSPEKLIGNDIMVSKIPSNVNLEDKTIAELQLNDLPDEVILNILSFLNIKELIKCQVSKRLREIVNDESLWLKVNLVRRQVPYDFIEKAAVNGCQYLSLADCNVVGLTGKSETSFNFKYLNVKGQDWCPGCPGIKKLIQNCSSLQKLSIADSDDISDLIQSICQSGQTLQVLYLTSRLDTTSKCFKNLFSNCVNLTEISFGSWEFSHGEAQMAPIQALVDNLTPTILKVDLNTESVHDEHVKKLVKRCNKITHLNLRWTSITIDSVHSIIEELKASLEELILPELDDDPDDPYEVFATLLELKSMPALNNVRCYLHSYYFHAEMLTRQDKSCEIKDDEDNEDWIFEIKANLCRKVRKRGFQHLKQNLFFKKTKNPSYASTRDNVRNFVKW